MNRRSRSTLFLMEQLIVVATFAICAAACVKILAASYFMANESRDTSNAIHAAESGAECYKAVSGDIGKTAELLGGSTASIGGAPAAVVYYDKDWAKCGEAAAEYVLQLVSVSDGAGSALRSGSLQVATVDGEEILSFMIAARGEG